VQYSAMCYPDGGIVDDLLVYKLADDKFMLVINASNIEKDFNWMKENNKFGVDLKNLSDDYSLLAVQGPNSKEVVQKICDKNLDLEYYHFMQTKVAGIDMIVSRTGYTGELGYELYFMGDEKTAAALWNKLFEAGKEYDIQPVGLAARDSLRLEMGFCLYGNDIDQTTNPLEAGLGWITKLKKQSFISKDVLLKVKADGLKRKLVPLITEEKAFPRKGYDITSAGRKIGILTSGTVSPVLDKAIALGYVETQFSEENTELNIQIRGKEVPAKVTKLPFVKK
jgi:aminomethyltransferase